MCETNTYQSSILTCPGFWCDFLPQLLSALAGFLGAALLFWWKIKREKKKEKESLQMELDDFYDYLKYSIERIVQPACSQVESFKELVKQLGKREVIDLHLKGVTAFNFKWFESIDKLKLQKAFFYSFKGSTHDRNYFYNQLLTRIDFLDLISRIYVDDFVKLVERGNKFEDLFNDGKMIIINLNDQIVMHLQQVGKEQLNNFEKDMIEAYGELLNVPLPDRLDMFLTYDKYLQKLPDILKKYPFPELVRVLNALRTCNYAIRSYEKNQELGITMFSDFTSGIEHSIKRLKIILERM